jgi:hypothetical protein
MAVQGRVVEESEVFAEGRDVQGAAKKLIRPGRGDLVVGREEKRVRFGCPFFPKRVEIRDENVN